MDPPARACGSLARGRTASEGAFAAPALRATLGRWARQTRFHAALASASSMAPYLRIDALGGVPAVIDLVDVDSQKWLDYAAAGRGPRAWLHRLEGRRLRGLERTLPDWARAVTLVSAAEAELYRSQVGPGPVHAVTNGVDLDAFRPVSDADERGCVFVGVLDYRPNVDGVGWFCREVWPEVRRRRPDAVLRLVGRSPSPEVQRLADKPGVELVGPVPDVRPYLAGAAVAVAPLRIARGVQNKVLEALAMGKAAVASPQALEGLGLESGTHVLAASSADEWAGAVVPPAGRPGPAAAARDRRAAARRGASPLGDLPGAVPHAAGTTGAPQTRGRSDGRPGPGPLHDRRGGGALHLTYRLSQIRGQAAAPGPLTPRAVHYRWLALGVLCLTVYGCLIPLRYRPMSLDEALAAFRRISYFDPSLLGARGDWVVSIVQFAASSYLVMGALSVDRRRAADLAAAAVVLPGIIALGIGLEFLQVYFPPRTVSLNDIAVESLGGVLGVLLWLLAGRRLTGWFRRFWGARGISGLAAQAFPAYLILLLIVELMPFDLMVGAGELAQKYREGRILLLPFQGVIAGGIGPLAKMLTNAACFFPLGVLAALIPRWTRGAGRSWREILPLGLAATALIELLQLFVYSRHYDATDIVTGTVAVLLGWRLIRDLQRLWLLGGVGWTYHRIAGRGGPGKRRAAWVLLACGWFGALALVSWQPFDFTTDPARFVAADGLLTDENTPISAWRRMAWAPLVDCYWGSKYSVIDQLVQKTLSFAPLGILMALGPCRGDRRGADLLVVLAALLLGLAIEAGQFFIPERHPSTTDLLVGCCGAWLGFAVACHIGAALWSEAVPIERIYEFNR